MFSFLWWDKRQNVEFLKKWDWEKNDMKTQNAKNVHGIGQVILQLLWAQNS